MLRSDYIANRFLTPMKVRADDIMNGPGCFAFRLSALNALGTSKGKVWK